MQPPKICGGGEQKRFSSFKGTLANHNQRSTHAIQSSSHIDLSRHSHQNITITPYEPT